MCFRFITLCFYVFQQFFSRMNRKIDECIKDELPSEDSIHIF